MNLRCIVCALLSSIIATLCIPLAFGQTAPQTAPAPSHKSKIVYREKSYYDFEDVLINGNLRKPDGSFIFRKDQTPFSSALNLRRSFMPELKSSATDAR